MRLPPEDGLGSHEMLRSRSMYQPSATDCEGCEFAPSRGVCFVVVTTCLAHAAQLGNLVNAVLGTLAKLPVTQH